MREEKASANHGLGSHMYTNIAYPRILSTQGFFFFFFFFSWSLGFYLPRAWWVGKYNEYPQGTEERDGRLADAQILDSQRILTALFLQRRASVLKP